MHGIYSIQGAEVSGTHWRRFWNEFPMEVGDYCSQSKMTNLFWRGYHLPPFSQKILLINKDILSLTLDASLKFSAIQSKTVTAHKPGPALYSETPLPSLCYMLEGGMALRGRKWKLHTEKLCYRILATPESWNEVQLLLTENIIYVFLKIESKNYINSNEV